MTPEDSLALRAEFPPEHVGKLPRGKTKKAKETPGVCKRRADGGEAPDWQDFFCVGWHALPAVHLDYVGHAAVTDRLLVVDPEWNWEPVAVEDDGRPRFERNANGQAVGLWIKLEVAGVARLGFGSVEAGKFDAEKQLIGDALRNAAMRFGVALDLWIKGHADEEDEREASASSVGAAPPDVDPRFEGWESRDAAMEAHSALREQISALPPEALTELAAWRKENEAGGWPLPKVAFDAFAEAVTLLGQKAAGAPGTASGGDVPPGASEAETAAQDGSEQGRGPGSPTEHSGEAAPPPVGNDVLDGVEGAVPAPESGTIEPPVGGVGEGPSGEADPTPLPGGPDTGHCSTCGAPIWRDDIGLWNHADEFAKHKGEPEPAGPDIDVDGLYARFYETQPKGKTSEEVGAEVAALTGGKVLTELRDLGLPIDGSPKVLKMRLLEYKQAQIVARQAE